MMSSRSLALTSHIIQNKRKDSDNHLYEPNLPASRPYFSAPFPCSPAPSSLHFGHHNGLLAILGAGKELSCLRVYASYLLYLSPSPLGVQLISQRLHPRMLTNGTLLVRPSSDFRFKTAAPPPTPTHTLSSRPPLLLYLCHTYHY